MKATGWNFASHSYGHINITKASLAAIKADAARWDADVKPIVGPTKEIIFAFGADISDTTPYSMRNPKYAFLHGVEGFDFFRERRRLALELDPVLARVYASGADQHRRHRTRRGAGREVLGALELLRSRRDARPGSSLTAVPCAGARMAGPRGRCDVAGRCPGRRPWARRSDAIAAGRC